MLIGNMPKASIKLLWRIFFCVYFLLSINIHGSLEAQSLLVFFFCCFVILAFNFFFTDLLLLYNKRRSLIRSRYHSPWKLPKWEKNKNHDFILFCKFHNFPPPRTVPCQQISPWPFSTTSLPLSCYKWTQQWQISHRTKLLSHGVEAKKKIKIKVESNIP